MVRGFFIYIRMSVLCYKNTQRGHCRGITPFTQKRRLPARNHVLSCIPDRKAPAPVLPVNIVKHTAEIKSGKVVLRSLRTADHLNTAVLFEKQFCAL